MQNGLARIQSEIETRQKFIDAAQRAVEPLRRLVQQHHVIDIAGVVPGLDVVLGVLVQFIEQHIGKKLAAQIAYGQAAVGCGVDKALVCGHGGQRLGASALHKVFAWVIEQDDLGQAAPPALRNLLDQQRPDDALVDGDKEIGQIDFQVMPRH